PTLHVPATNCSWRAILPGHDLRLPLLWFDYFSIHLAKISRLTAVFSALKYELWAHEGETCHRNDSHPVGKRFRNSWSTPNGTPCIGPPTMSPRASRLIHRLTKEGRCPCDGITRLFTGDMERALPTVNKLFTRPLSEWPER